MPNGFEKRFNFWVSTCTDGIEAVHLGRKMQ